MSEVFDAEDEPRRRASGAASGRAEGPSGLVWLNGSLVDAPEATVSIFDHGLTVGDGVFDTLKAVDGRPFAVRRHLERLQRSAEGLGLRLPYAPDTLRAAMAEVLASHDLPLARVRITVTGGQAPLGSERGEGQATVVIAVGELKPPEPSTAVCVVPWPRNERGAMVGIKTTSYAENVRALAFARERGCTEAIFPTTTDHLSEGTGSNVFVAIGGRLLTPPLSSGCLAGVTRDLVLSVTDAVEEDIPMAAFRDADEIFLTSTGRDVQPVHDVDGRRYPVDGPLTAAAAEGFQALAASSDDP
jgi:branched-chain amino acid aminotransferase